VRLPSNGRGGPVQGVITHLASEQTPCNKAATHKCQQLCATWPIPDSPASSKLSRVVQRGGALRLLLAPLTVEGSCALLKRMMMLLAVAMMIMAATAVPAMAHSHHPSHDNGSGGALYNLSYMEADRG
jgi:hypothetical protein